MTVDHSSFRNEWGHGRMVLVPFRDAQGRLYCFATLLLSRRLSRAIVGLTEAARRITSGDLSQAARVIGRVEIERLSQALNDMRSSISEKIDALHERTEELDRHFTLPRAEESVLGDVA
jgi:methyl-accepting chemotaxis protein